MMTEDLFELANNHMYVVVITLITLAVLGNALIRAGTTIVTTHARERSRREIAAYIAEGSLTPEQGERIMRAEVDVERRRRV